MMNREPKFSLEPEMQEALQRLLRLLNENEVIRSYQQIEEKVKDHPGLHELTEEIKQFQQDAVKFAHYGKPEAERIALRKADELTKQFDEHPLVVSYRERLIEANDLLQHVTNTIEEKVNQELENKSQHNGKNENSVDEDE